MAWRPTKQRTSVSREDAASRRFTRRDFLIYGAATVGIAGLM